MAAWKQHTTTTLQEKIRNLQLRSSGSRKTTHRAVAPLPSRSPFALQSKVVTVTAHPDGIVVVKMEDREAKNMFSDALDRGDQGSLRPYRADAGL